MNHDLRALFDAAKIVMACAHVPYSRFQVGAAIRAGNGKIYAGCNVENAAYPIGTCAEAGAIAAMIADGAKEIVAIAIVGSDEAPCYPCGACRQRIREFSTADTRVHVAGQSLKEIRSHSSDELLPHSFGPEMLP